MFSKPTRDGTEPSPADQIPKIRDFHFGFFSHLVVAVQLLQDFDRYKTEINECLKGPGVYIGPEERRAFEPRSLEEIELLRDRMLDFIRESMTKEAGPLLVLGPDWGEAYGLSPGVVDADKGFYSGLDSDWPQELINRRPSWGLSISLWDHAYYLIGQGTFEELADNAYPPVARHLFDSMADKAVLFVQTNIYDEKISNCFMQAFKNAGWDLLSLDRSSNASLLLLKGFTAK